MDRYRQRIAALRAAVLDSDGALGSEARRAAAAGSGVPDDATAYVAKVRDEAHKVTDDDIASLRRAGYSEEQIFELTVSTALGAGLDRLDVVRRAMRDDE